MKKEQVFPFVERENYSLPAWINDTLNIIKQKGFMLDKNTAMMCFVENSAEFMDCYCDGLSPMQAYLDFLGEEDE